MNAANIDDNFDSFHENQYIECLRKLTNLKDYQILDLFDLFDYEDTGRISFSEFFLTMSLIAARASGECTNFLYRHGEHMFKILSTLEREGPVVQVQRLIGFGVILGVSEEDILKNLLAFGTDSRSSLEFQEFMTCSFALLDALDKQLKYAEMMERKGLEPEILCTTDNRCTIS